ncbi:mannose-1-phosphate guanylyltransferase/mannose-6-phosphate isomerase [Mesorhizobium sp. M1C.F.Ca.ET.193.01.1.1]|uniref:mannose-1-phosphate guanylyltransferase/mannose-6-phosphate isomerase n=2 Tax=Mesorhizobium TaxID=68287 RepID=UPI000FD1EE5F|nr:MULTISPECIES: mannose-1-phosphate guanylyltransferase/mannose-6-phosphate isomerase [unclassified Mesorhizobium]TGS94992.1 mannose-1-phosphate guanylyltransferase/mannose-6-phosphate isomerase [bacterium M00.F.Ca.ET.177.01.1.1]TGQ51334.1 mannose-1-phosphate guanylyltransferase/mannose-6-phosphate isomerase [Mesorhizobium sp. M1C.F.Ca.ET.210.01.1.1]TGQ67122.1 mannose-1-phosphate guanylyltransferase/mannose-6-phosphate isomerase [Mesorhizobium sp. M1C.F.Ca.ET.212.01.1.1]TGR01618.1 mannose-1-ph
MKIVPVIISGGVGSRLWPISRALHPKPFIPLPEGGTLIRKTYARAVEIEGVDHVVTVTNRDLLFLTADEYAEVAASGVKNTFLLEPFGRDTAAAIALAALQVARQKPEAILLVLPADHLIVDQAGFRASVAKAASLAASGQIVTFGVKPDRPETGFGYIEAEGDRVLRFVEKPNAATAAQFIASGRFFWNSGMFCFTAGSMIAAMQDLCPEVLSSARTALENGRASEAADRLAVEVDKDSFAAVPAVSIDYAVMEKVGNVGFVPCGFDWSDIGSWSVLSKLVSADDSGNRATGEAILHEAANCYVHSEDRLVGVVGVQDLLIIDTPDALLVAHKDKAQEVKDLYNRLKAEGHETATVHRTVHRPWGTYTVLEEGHRFKIKRIEVKPNARLSLQAHHHRSEHWVVVSGTAKVVNGESEILLTTNQSTYIPCGHKHRLENPGILPLVMIEVQSGEYLGEDDIVRFDDVYGRA